MQNYTSYTNLSRKEESQAKLCSQEEEKGSSIFKNNNNNKKANKKKQKKDKHARLLKSTIADIYKTKKAEDMLE